MTVIEIVEQYLREHGYDGLYAEGECACKLGEVGPCDAVQGDCCAGYLAPCDCGEHDWHIQETKP
jgi:hypothetical protein